MDVRDKQQIKEWSVGDFLMQMTRTQIIAAAERFPIALRPTQPKQEAASQMEALYLFFPAAVLGELDGPVLETLLRFDESDCELPLGKGWDEQIFELASLGMAMVLTCEGTPALAVAPRSLLRALKRHVKQMNGKVLS